MGDGIIIDTIPKRKIKNLRSQSCRDKHYYWDAEEAGNVFHTFVDQRVDEALRRFGVARAKVGDYADQKNDNLKKSKKEEQT